MIEWLDDVTRGGRWLDLCGYRISNEGAVKLSNLSVALDRLLHQ